MQRLCPGFGTGSLSLFPTEGLQPEGSFPEYAGRSAHLPLDVVDECGHEWILFHYLLKQFLGGNVLVFRFGGIYLYAQGDVIVAEFGAEE